MIIPSPADENFSIPFVYSAAATVFFATFNGRYLRYEHELEKKAKEEDEDEHENALRYKNASTAYYGSQEGAYVTSVSRQQQAHLSPAV